MIGYWQRIVSIRECATASVIDSFDAWYVRALGAMMRKSLILLAAGMMWRRDILAFD